MSKYAKMDGLVEMVVELRDAGTKWDAEGGIVTQIRAAFPEYSTKSAIPLRRLYDAAKVEAVAKPTKSRVIAMRAAGDGWTKIADALGSTVAEVKKLAGDSELANGRVYLDGDGNARIVDLAAVKAAKANVAKPTVAMYSAARG